MRRDPLLLLKISANLRRVLAFWGNAVPVHAQQHATVEALRAVETGQRYHRSTLRGHEEAFYRLRIQSRGPTAMSCPRTGESTVHTPRAAPRPRTLWSRRRIDRRKEPDLERAKADKQSRSPGKPSRSSVRGQTPCNPSRPRLIARSTPLPPEKMGCGPHSMTANAQRAPRPAASPGAEPEAPCQSFSTAGFRTQVRASGSILSGSSAGSYTSAFVSVSSVNIRCHSAYSTSAVRSHPSAR